MSKEDVAAAEGEAGQAALAHHQAVDAPGGLVRGIVDDDVAPGETDLAYVGAARLARKQCELSSGGRLGGKPGILGIAVVIRRRAVVDGVAAGVGSRSR